MTLRVCSTPFGCFSFLILPLQAVVVVKARQEYAFKPYCVFYATCSAEAISELLNTDQYVTVFWKTDHLCTFHNSRNANLKH